MRECKDCKFDKDAVMMVECSSHVWHKEMSFDDMCCVCGLDAEILVK